jgi:hypothetical protein
MAQLSDTSPIQRLIRRARVRIRLQNALEGATTATILAAASAAISVFLVRTGVVEPAAGIAMLIGSGALIAIGAVLGASRNLDDERVARRIDRASNLADRLSTAIAFSRDFAAGRKPVDGDDGVTEDMMAAAIADGVRAVPRANLRAATPFSRPRDLWGALVFLCVAALVSGLALGSRDDVPVLYRAEPYYAPPGARVTISGSHLTPTALPPPGASVVLATRPVTILDWVPDQIDVAIPADAVLGKQSLIVGDALGRLGSVEVVIVDAKDPRYHKADSVVLDPDERAYVEDLLAQLRETAKKDNVPDLDEFAKKIEELLKKAENGEITKEQLLEALSKAEDALAKNAEPKQDEVDKKLDEMGKQLSKDPLTKELGDALQKQDLEKAQQELEKLADKLDKKELDQKQKDELSKQLDQVSKQMEKQDKQDQQKQQDKQQQLQKEIEKLQDQQKNAKTEQEKQQLQPRLEEKQRELQKLQREEQQKQQSEQRRALQRLQKDMEKAAEDLQQKQPKDGQDKDSQDQQNEQNEKQASRNLHDAARETGKVDRDKRKQAAQKKMSSQMDDLREAMRRAKQKGNKGPQDPFNRNGKNQDFAQRAQGKQGQGGQGWKPGQGQGQGQQGKGQGQNGQNGQGSGNGGDDWGTGHDDNLTGDPTQKTGNDKDQDLQGQQSSEGGSVRETILAAAQKGFASTSYKKVYTDYQRVVEEVMRNEKLPSSYKYYVKRYFAKIHPNIVDSPDSEPAANPKEPK